jgi:hypothetical protein
VTTTRAITVRQPWAWAIAEGGKLVENRSRGTRHRGPLLIHAGVGWSTRGASDARLGAAFGVAWGLTYPEDHTGPYVREEGPAFYRGRVIAVAELVDSHPASGCCAPWGEQSYAEAGGKAVTTVHHLVLEDVRPLAFPVTARGQLGLWTPAPEVLDAVHRVLTAPTQETSRA